MGRVLELVLSLVTTPHLTEVSTNFLKTVGRVLELVLSLVTTPHRIVYKFLKNCRARSGTGSVAGDHPPGPWHHEEYSSGEGSHHR